MPALSNVSTPVVRVHQKNRFPAQTPWPRYEQLKRDWVRTHPDATPEQYERAIASICKWLGV